MPKVIFAKDERSAHPYNVYIHKFEEKKRKEKKNVEHTISLEMPWKCVL